MTAAIILGVIATYALVIGVYRGVIGEERWGGSTAHVKARITSAPSCPVQRALDDLIAAHNALGAPGMKP